MQSPLVGVAPAPESAGPDTSAVAGRDTSRLASGIPVVLAVAALVVLGPRAAWSDAALASLVSLAVLAGVLARAATPLHIVAVLGAGSATLLLAKGDSAFHSGGVIVAWLVGVVARWLGLRVDHVDGVQPLERRPSHGQFSIAEIGLATAFVAALLMAARLLAEQPPAGGLGPRLAASGALCLLQIALATSIRGTERAAVFSAVACLAMLPLAPALGGLTTGGFDLWRDREASTLVTTLLVLALLPRGYNVGWRARSTP